MEFSKESLQFEKQARRRAELLVSLKGQKVRINYFHLNWYYSRFATFGSLKINKSS